ncbi:MAG: zinc-ribbon domain-containing protein [Maribacter sp.]|nr:zinc-ribbon domain-containing protein [Maribacter sp.]
MNKNVASEWHFEKNFPLLPRNFKIQSSKRVWWKCEKGHEWESPIHRRTSYQKSGCPYCANKRADDNNNLHA